MAKEKDYFWQIQGLTSFCKARGDWLEFDRVHLSFVKHEGKANNCKQILAIEGAIKLHGSDGALFLSELVLSGAAKKMAIKAKEEASNGYPQPIFSSMGGTVSSRSQKGQCMFRQFSVAPGTKSDFVLQMMTCPGEENATGGIQPIKGAKRDTVYVPLSSGDLADFARSIQMEVTAFRTAKMLSGTSAEKNEVGNACETLLTSSPTPAEDSMLVIIYETTGIVNNGMPFVAHVDNSINELKTVIQMLLAATELTDEQFAIVCQKIEEKRAKDALAKPMTMPTAEELSYLHTKKPTPETPTEKPTDKMLDETTAADTHYNNAEVQASKKAVVQKEKSEKRAAMEAEKAKRKAETEEARAEKKMAKEAAQAKKTAAEEEERRKKEEAREAAKKAAQEKKAEKARVREEKRASTNQTTKLSLFVAALASALITIILIGGLFFYFVNSGFITINSSPRINGLVIYDDVVSGGAAGVSPIANCFTL